jgi:hypothetical protein
MAAYRLWQANAYNRWNNNTDVVCEIDGTYGGWEKTENRQRTEDEGGGVRLPGKRKELVIER